MARDSSNLRNYEQMRVGWMNAESGNLHELDGITCNICKNKGRIYYIDDDGYEVCKECECMEKRKTKRRMMESGLGHLLERCTFDTYRTDAPWQKIVKELAGKYILRPDSWLFVSGQSGSGKTHICTAICNVLLGRGSHVTYRIWGDLFRELDANAYNYDTRQRILADIRGADVLYIDDFLKNYKSYPKMVAIAFDVINERYNARKPLILSTEYPLAAIEGLDMALAGRIDEMSQGNKIQIREAMERNLRKNK